MEGSEVNLLACGQLGVNEFIVNTDLEGPSRTQTRADLRHDEKASEAPHNFVFAHLLDELGRWHAQSAEN